MKVQAWCYGIAYDYLKRNLPSAESAIMLAPGIADAFAPTITKLVQALRLIQGHSTNCRDVDIATEALAELEKP